ncbi:hypothetical protein HMPREF1318_2639 [Actinomyces massiliensis F0489]|uniref:Uncharacterized protein n=1 Tax=Actinomyces massiliensis F0489 TaxID=1125718 RepID=J0MTY9_9ACTO|nr:hypothetical protein HMPREF1318_2639 [Actinomyces massiliensis F0489]
MSSGPTRALRRDRSGSAARSVEFRVEIGRTPRRDRSGAVISRLTGMG